MSEIATRTPMQEIVTGIRSDTFKQQIAIALPGNVTADRFVRVAVTAIQQNPDIITADRDSIIRSLIRCAQDGLLPDGREAALVKFGGDAVYMPMIGGFRKIAAEHGWAIDTQVVYENDTFAYELGISPKLTHKPPRLDEERGDPIGAYAVGTHADGRKQVEVLTKADIEKVRSVSRSRERGPWKDWTARMWEKTAGRRLFAKLPLGGNEKEQERIASVKAASDAEYDLESGEPKMSLDEANISASAAGQIPTDDSGPDDTLEGEIVDEGHGGQVSFANLVPPGARGES